MRTIKISRPLFIKSFIALASLIVAVSSMSFADTLKSRINVHQHQHVGEQINHNKSDQAVVPVTQKPKIQMAILLDTSNSMDGLIDQTRNQLWSVVNEFSAAKRNGVTPILEVALFEYGNDRNDQEQGYVRRLNQFTRELDRVSEGLFSLDTNGGSEFCGFAIKVAVNQLQWSQSDKDIKTIFIAGNEPFTQGPVRYQKAIKLAAEKGIVVNTIFAGELQQGINSGWQNGALMANGDYMSINADRQIVHIDAPQDQQIAILNSKLNETYLPYGHLGKESSLRQAEQDKKNKAISSGLLAKRAKSKSSSFYDNSSWDLVDALREGKVEEAELATLDEQQLPVVMQEMSAKERKDYIQKQAAERAKIKGDIAALSKEREAYVAKQRVKQSKTEEASVSDALSAAVKKQAGKKGFKLGSENE